MGLLSSGSPLSWPETQAYASHVHSVGVEQFISQYNRLRSRCCDSLKWGDEVEYMILRLDRTSKKAYLSLRAGEILNQLDAITSASSEDCSALWRPEYASYMLESTPGRPYGGLLEFCNTVESNMHSRRRQIQSLLHADEIVLTLTSFPRLGCGVFTSPQFLPSRQSSVACSNYVPDECILDTHPRFRTLTRNIRERRGKKVVINMPVYEDTNTAVPFHDPTAITVGGVRDSAATTGHVHMDAMAFGMGCCCLQITFQAENINEARYLYDQLNPFCPILLALTAASPIHKGFLLDTDCRWTIISKSCDCRTDEERGVRTDADGPSASQSSASTRLSHSRVNKSRYDSIDSYLSHAHEQFNDVPIVINVTAYERLKQAGIDDMLARHIAHLFIRDPVSLFSENIKSTDELDMDHFENIQSTNWQTMRFKPPPHGIDDVGWRVEFRPCEVQLTDFENAAIVCFIVILTRAILSYRLDFVVPISKVDENMTRSQLRDAIRTQKFWFRRDYLKRPSSPPGPSSAEEGDCVYGLFSISEIFNGNHEFPGLINLMFSYLDSMNIEADTRCTISQYIRFIQARASGDIMTTACWIRQFVTSHPDYNHDSVVTESLCFDLIAACEDISNNRGGSASSLLGSFVTRTKQTLPEEMKRTPFLHKQK